MARNSYLMESPNQNRPIGPHVIIGTAGHIDHGKSAVVKALTDTDPDRLKEEQVRGMTIDLGYAFYDEKTAFIDVPGHERFIKNMVAGTSTIDFVLFVVAADDGIMPQTIEHLDILTFLGVERGIIVLNKIDLVDQEWLELVQDEIRNLTKETFLAEAALVRFSALTKEGIETLRAEIDQMITNHPQRFDRGFFWMPIDRSFTIQGFGTVVTGSVMSGELKKGEEVEILPKGRREKVRGLQRHGETSELISVGDRGAINLQNVARSEVMRGDVVSTPGCGVSTRRLDIALRLLRSSARPIKDQARIRLHVGTSEILARIRLLDCEQLEPGESCLSQLLLEKQVSVNRNDRFVIRSYSPSVTIGGGIILDNSPMRRHKRGNSRVAEYLRKMQTEEADGLILEYLSHSRRPKSLNELVRAIGISTALLQQPLSKLTAEGLTVELAAGASKLYTTVKECSRLEQDILTILKEFHDGHRHLPGIGRAELLSRLKGEETIIPFLEFILSRLIQDKKIRSESDVLALSSFEAGLHGADRALYDKIIQLLDKSGFSPPTVKEISDHLASGRSEVDLALEYGRAKHELVIFKNGLIYRKETLSRIQDLVQDAILKNGSITAAQLRDLIQASRKYSVMILEYFDQIGFTSREGDERVLND